MELNFGDLIDIVISQQENAEEIIKHLCEWKYKLDMFLLQAFIGLAVSLFIGIFFNYQNFLENLILILPVVIALCFLLVIVRDRYLKLKENKDLFIASIKLYSKIKKFLEGK